MRSGLAGLALLGSSRVARFVEGASVALGTVTAWCRPWFEITFDSGAVVSVQKRDLEASLLFSPADFFDPRHFFFDFGIFNPTRVGGWVAGMLAFLDMQRVLLPARWRDPLGWSGAAPGGGDPSRAAGDVDHFRDATAAECQALLIELSGESLRESTLDNLRFPAYKALWWFASMGRQMPPTAEDVAQYLAYLSGKVDSIGSVADARGAIGFLATCNGARGWDRAAILGGRATLPLEALRRRHARAVNKAPGLPKAAVQAILIGFAFVRPQLTWDLQWRLAIGVAIGTAFKLMARYADMRFVMYDDGAFLVFATHIRVYVSERKTHVYGGQWIDIARPADGSLGVYHALPIGKSVFREGHVMPHVDKDGRVHRDRPMEYHHFVDHLRSALVQIGYTPDEAPNFSAHSMRPGVATEMVHSGLPPLLACTVAGVKSIDWLVGYMRADLGDRLRASWSIGL